MAKPKLLYYAILQYQSETLALLNENFDVTELEDPSRDTDDVLATAEVV
jgi:hypothetical protein